MPKAPTPLNDRQRRFCELLVGGGMSARQAYIKAGYSPKGADGAATKLQGIAKVKAYLEELRADARKAAKVNRDRAIEILSEVVTTPIGEIDANHPLAQEVRVGTDKDGNEVSSSTKMPGKIEALRELAKILGWYEPEKHEVTGFSVIDDIRKKRDI